MSSSWLYPEGTCNFMPTDGPALWYDPLGRKTTLLHWAYCWQSPWISKANGSVLNVSEVSNYFEAQATGVGKDQPGGYAGSMWAGAGLDECLSGNSKVNSRRREVVILLHPLSL